MPFKTPTTDSANADIRKDLNFTHEINTENQDESAETKKSFIKSWKKN
jgi:hypothetical protein